MQRLRIFAILICCMVAGAAGAQTAAWPTRPITMVVPFGAGGPVDLVGRIMAGLLSEKLGQQVIVENMGGGGGSVGAARIAKSPPDGYSFLFGNQGTHIFTHLISKKPLYDPVADFAPVAVVVENSKLLITRPDFPANSLAEFASYAKANEGKMQFGSAGIGSATHVTCVLLNLAIGVSITHVPYRSTTAAMQDVIGGRIDYVCDVISTTAPLLQSGTLKALALLSPRRNPLLPELATADEQGVHGIGGDGWNAFFFPHGTPAAIVNRLASATNEILDNAAVRERLLGLGLNVPLSERRTPAYLAKLVASELDKWAAPIRASGAVEE
jgi:tripartite-type tricarboxylate transporter receptor subunit TctC